MKRFSETEKWKDPWFRGLRPASKLLFLYIVDSCNNAGFWEEDKDFSCYSTGLNSEQYDGAIKGLNRGLIGADGWYWVRTFLKHQKNSELNPDNKAHKQIISLLREQAERFKSAPEFQQFIAPYKGLLSPTGIGIGKGQVGEVQEGDGKKRKSSKPSWPEEEVNKAKEMVNRLFSRRSTTRWSEKEEESLRKAMPFTEEDMAMIETYYTEERRKNGEGRHRRDLLTFLNNFPGELDRSRNRKRFQPACDV
jgi:hypothetical protein